MWSCGEQKVIQESSLIATFHNAAVVALGIFTVSLLVLSTLMWLAFRLLRSIKEIQKEAATQAVARAVAEKMLNQDAGPAWPLALRETVKDYLNARNAFWEVFVGVVLAIFVVLVLTILMVFQVISPEAGLPILAAVISYVLGRGSAKSNSTTNLESSPREDREERP